MKYVYKITSKVEKINLIINKYIGLAKKYQG
jgi:hypothetical protein